MIYKTCFIAYWKKEVMLPHSVFRISLKIFSIQFLIISYLGAVLHALAPRNAGVPQAGGGEHTPPPHPLGYPGVVQPQGGLVEKEVAETTREAAEKVTNFIFFIKNK